MAAHFKFRARNVSQLVNICSHGEKYLAGANQGKVEIIQNGTIIINQAGLIEAIGKTEDLEAKYAGATFDVDLDGTNKSIIPGLVDAHTHPVWSGDRVHEFAMKLAGATYMQVHQQGGGIGFTVRHTRESSEEELLNLLLARLKKLVRHGTTLAEVKSGYGLDLPTEMKLLRVLHRARALTPLELSVTYLGAHSVPRESNADTYTNEIITEHLPEIQRLVEAKEISLENIDVFFEKNIFEEENTRKILEAGKALGLQVNFHGDELNFVRAGEVGGELGALAISHLEHVSQEGARAMAIKPTFAVLLPTTAYILRIAPPPARMLIDENVPIALGTDFNPNAHCVSLPLTMNLACVTLKMNLNEALVAATLNAAGSLGKSSTHGSLEVGKEGDLLVLETPSWEHIIYQMGESPIELVVKAGQIVHRRPVDEIA